MFAVRSKKADSWLDPESAGILGWKLGKRLWARCDGHEGRFITLTYDRAPYADAQDCFDRARSQKHVSRFMRKLGTLLGRDLKGKWICKMEFQQGGWVHWHILLLDVGFIDPHQFNQIYQLWGKGGIHVKPMTEENVKYLTKYVAKDGTIPGWVYTYPSRSIKVVRPSCGFWNDQQAAIARERTAERKATQSVAGKEQPTEEYYAPIGETIDRERHLFQVGEKYFSIECDRHVLGDALRKYCSPPRVQDGWLHYAEGQEVLARVIAYCEAAGDRANDPTSEPWSTADSQGDFSRRPLFLRGTGKRAGWWKVRCGDDYLELSPHDLAGRLSRWWAKHAPWYLRFAWEQEARYVMGMDMHGNWGWPPDAVEIVA